MGIFDLLFGGSKSTPFPEIKVDTPMTIDYIALANELNTDPTGRGYAPNIAAGADGANAALLNAIIPGNKVNYGYVPSEQFPGLLVQSEYDVLTQPQRDYITALLTAPRIDLSNQNIRNGLGAIFPSGKTTRTNILAAQQRDGSRAETLFGIGTIITAADVAKALGR